MNQIQPGQSLMQQNPQSVASQQQAQQTTLQQQPMPMSHQTTLSQQQRLIGHQNSISDIQQEQQRRLLIENNLLLQQLPHSLYQQSMSLHQQQQHQLGSQINLPVLQQQQQHPQLLGSLPNVSNMQPHQGALDMQKNESLQQQLQQLLQQQQQQQQNQQSSLTMSPQSQHQASQQQLMFQFQNLPTLMRHQLTMQQQSNSLHWEMQQKLNTLLKTHNTMEQKQFIQTQRGFPEGSSSSNTSVDSTAQTGRAVVIDPQEDCFQKIKSMKDLYFDDLNEFHQKVAMRLQQQEALLPFGKQSDAYEKLKGFKMMLERMFALLQISKNNIPPNMKEKLIVYEKQMRIMVASHRSKKVPQGQQQFQHSNGNSHVSAQQLPSQVFIPLSTAQQPGSAESGQQVGLGSLQNSMNLPYSIPVSNINHSLLDEEWEINQSLIDTVVDVSDEDTSASKGGEGTVTKCSSLNPDLKAHFSAAQMDYICKNGGKVATGAGEAFGWGFMCLIICLLLICYSCV